jgi:hypothetical protein
MCHRRYVLSQTAPGGRWYHRHHLQLKSLSSTINDAMTHQLPPDLWRLLFKDWVYSVVLLELYRYHHAQRLTKVLDEGIGFPRDPYFVTTDGVFILPKDGQFYYVCLDTKDWVRYLADADQRDFSVEIEPTRETQQLLDDFRRSGPRPGHRPQDHLEAFQRIPKHYTVSILSKGRKTRGLTFAQSVVSETDEDVCYIRFDLGRRFVHAP